MKRFVLSATQARKKARNEFTFTVKGNKLKKLRMLACVLSRHYMVDIIDRSVHDDSPIIWSNY